MNEKQDQKIFSVKTDVDIIDRLDRLFYTRKLDGTVGNKYDFMKELYEEYLESKGF